MSKRARVIFDGPPGPEPGRFVEVEDESGASIGLGMWFKGESLTEGEPTWALEFEHPDEAYLRGLRDALAAVEAEREKAVAEDGTPQPRHFGLVTAKVAIERLLEEAEGGSDEHRRKDRAD